VDLTAASYVIFAIVLYYVALFVLSAHRRKGEHDLGYRPLFVVMVPARNEELVLDETLSSLSALDYSGPYRVLVLDDGSTDGTWEICERWTARDPRIRAIHRDASIAGRGKSAVLNHGYRTVRESEKQHDPWLGGATTEDIVLGIVDADGRLEDRCLEVVAPYFGPPAVGTTQIGVRIANADRSLLARLQDMEFVAFTWLVQIARDHLGSSGLGGNGQFTRLSALASIGSEPWEPNALTEDLDLGLQLVERGWRTRFCHLTYVDQQGLERWRPLLRQRTRWIQGHYQCWRHIPKLWRSRRVPMGARLDLSLYLLLVVTVLLVTSMLVLDILGSEQVVSVHSSFLVGVIPAGISYRTISLLLSILPLATFMTSYQLHSSHRFRWFEVPAAAALFTMYTYVWTIATFRAWWRIVFRKNAWVKTPRVAT
jgi:1,2-diacylglycerol 3-beta-glucosyltransferase